MAQKPKKQYDPKEPDRDDGARGPKHDPKEPDRDDRASRGSKGGASGGGKRPSPKE